jgi:hypothetical protein
MGILCELFVSSRSDAFKFERRLDTATPPQYIRAEAKGLQPVDFESLWAVLVAEPFDPRRHQLEDLYFASHHTSGLGLLKQRLLIWKAMAKALVGADVGNTWLHRFPPALVRRLAGMEPQSMGPTAAGWLSTMKRSSRNADELRGILLELQRLARQAEESGLSMFVWGSV